MPTPNSTVESGRIIGNYRVLGLIGAGGMAEVHEAEHVRLGRMVALKILKPHYASRPEAVRSFFEEARLVSALNHPNIVQVTDLIVEPGMAVCVMELLEGKTLADALEEQGPLDVPDALRIAHSVADALAAAHAAGVVHRDIKPDNIFLARDRPGHVTVKLLDFGVAHLMDEAQSPGGSSLSVRRAGTPAYMSPEQIQGQPVKPSSDIYSMGVVTYQMLTGKLPIIANSLPEYIYKHAHHHPVPPHKAVEPPRAISKRCSNLVMQCLAKDPDQRIQDGAALCAAIEQAAKRTGIRIHKGTQPAMVRTSAGFGHLIWLLLILAALAAVGLWTTSRIFETSGGREERGPGLSVSSHAKKDKPAVGKPGPRQKGTTGMAGRRETDAAPGAKAHKKAQPKSRTLRILSDPKGAQVLLLSPSERVLGITPLDLTLPTDQKQWVVKVQAQGAVARTLTLNQKTRSPVRVRLEPIPDQPSRTRHRKRTRHARKRQRRRGRPRRGAGHTDSFGTVNPFHSSQR